MPHIPDKVAVLQAACTLLSQGRQDAAIERVARDYPPAGPQTSRRAWSPSRLLRLFKRDGFTDRYSGQPLVFPGTLLALSVLLPDQFPYHRNWKQSATHPAYYDCYATLDHVVPVARGGADDESNAVTTSMLRNSAKSNWLLVELGWPERLAPPCEAWDGLLGWFLESCTRDPGLAGHPWVKRWYRAAKADAYPG